MHPGVDESGQRTRSSSGRKKQRLYANLPSHHQSVLNLSDINGYGYPSPIESPANSRSMRSREQDVELPRTRPPGHRRHPRRDPTSDARHIFFLLDFLQAFSSTLASNWDNCPAHLRGVYHCSPPDTRKGWTTSHSLSPAGLVALLNTSGKGLWKAIVASPTGSSTSLTLTPSSRAVILEVGSLHLRTTL